jgi:RNA polymerase sigma factor (sigma-70 family)
MTELEDHELLADFARNGSETAFAALVSRHLGLVYSTALRFSHNPHHAQEIAQAVFIILARKAGGLSPHVVLSGWLYQTARLTAANFIKGEIRRQRREQEVYMQSTLNETDSLAWEKIAPLLDEAMGGLGETDRNAVVLRYFENKNAAEIGVKLRLTEETARKRVNRALEKLRKFFHKRGVVSSAAIIAGAISANSVQAAPAGLAHTISAVAITKGALAGSSTLTLVHGALKLMAWSTAKTAIVASVAFILATGAATITVRTILAQPVSFIRIEGHGQIELGVKPVSRVVETGQMVILTDGKSYRISLVSKGGGTLTNDIYDITAEYGSDGVDNFVVSDRFSPLNPTPGILNGFAHAGRVPADEHSTLSIVDPAWMAYCSSDFFNNSNHQTGLAIGQIFSSMIWPDYVTNLVTYWPNSTLPQSITGWSRNWVIEQRTNSLQPTKAFELKQYPHGFKTWKFTASDPITVGSIRVPRQLTLETFFPKPPDTATTGDDTMPLRKATFTMDSVEIGHGKFEPLPPVNVPDLQIYDHRFEDIAGNFVIASHATPKGWPVRGSKAFEQAAADARRLGAENHTMIEAELKTERTVNPP